MSRELPNYCQFVLANAVRRDGETMPQCSEGPIPTTPACRNNYLPHIEALSFFCRAESPLSGGFEVLFRDYDIGVPLLTAPVVQAPLYACARSVSISGLYPAVEVQLLVDGTETASGEAGPGGDTSFELPTGLVAGQTVVARQRLTSSEPWVLSDTASVIAFEGQFPQPRIYPILHECANRVSVHSIPGARVQVIRRNPATQASASQERDTAFDWSIFEYAEEFEEGEEFAVRASLCGDWTAVSEPVVVGPRLAKLRKPQAEPERFYVGQTSVYVYLDEGAYARISRKEGSQPWASAGETPPATMGRAGFTFSSPLTFDSRVRMTSAMYCNDVSQETTTNEEDEVENQPLSCSLLPPSVIAAPHYGDDFVVVMESLPGAWVRIYAENGEKLGEGGGTIIRLSRELGHEVLTAVQSVEACDGSRGWQTQVLSPGGE
ncbi:MAG: hypothetical protein HC923_03920 [Myxococcales bacterium]|nr:hypothetical protein [Myxococcales bacterium]